MQMQTDRSKYNLRYQAEQIVERDEGLELIQPRDPNALPEPFSLATVFDNPPALAPVLIEGVLRQGHKMVLSGPSKAGKSFALMELCIAIAEGKTWLGNQCAQGKVLYINMEIDRRSCINRFKKIYAASEKLFEAKHPENIEIWSLRGHSQPISKLVGKIIETAKHSYKAIVLDPLYKLIEGDENSNSDVSKMVSNFDRITEETEASVIYAHHFAKGTGGDKDVIDRAAGAGTFARDPDAIITLTQLNIKDIDGNNAWRVDFVLREFPNKEPYDVWFIYPLHIYTENLKDVSVVTSATKKQKKADDANEQKKNKQEQIIEDIIEKVSETNGQFLFRRFYEWYKTVENVTDKTARRRLNALGYYPDPSAPLGSTPHWIKKDTDDNF